MTAPALDAHHIETEIVDILEQALGRAGFDQVDAVSRPGLATLYVARHGDADLMLENIRASIPVRELPAEAEPPVIAREGPEPHRFVVGSDRLSSMELGSRWRSITDALQSMPGVLQVSGCGQVDREIRVHVDPGKLAASGLDLPAVIAALEAGNLQLPAGRIASGSRDVAIRVQGQALSIPELQALVLGTRGGAPLRLGDLARIEDGVAPPDCVARHQGRPVISGAVRVHGDADVAAVRRRLDELAGSGEPLAITWLDRQRHLRIATITGLDRLDVRTGDLLIELTSGPPGQGGGPTTADIWLPAGDLPATLEALRSTPGVAAVRELGTTPTAAWLACADRGMLDSAARALRQAPAAARPFIPELSTAELSITIDRDADRNHGIDPATISRAITAATGGVTVATWRTPRGDTIPVRLFLGAGHLAAIDTVSSLRLRDRSGALIPLTTLARIELRATPTTLFRTARQPALPVWLPSPAPASITALVPLLPSPCTLRPQHPDRW